MPVYEYLCESCGLRFERMQHFSDDPLRECPDCGGAVHRVIQPVGVIFKGSGFYVTDSRSKSPTVPKPKRKDGAKAGPSGHESDDIHKGGRAKVGEKG